MIDYPKHAASGTAVMKADFTLNNNLPGKNTIGIKLVLICLLGLMSIQTYAETASRAGGTGMSWMRTADTLSNGEMVFYDQLGVDSYVILNSNLNDYDTFNTLGLNYGLFNPLELGIQTTYLSNDQHKTSGIRSYKGIVKFQILGNKDIDKYAIALSTFKTTSPADKSQKLGSGEVEDGAEINTSYYGDDINLHLTLGSATSDAKYYNPDVVYYSVEKQYAYLGAEFKVSKKFIFGIETLQEQSENINFDKNQLFAFSLQYKPGKHWDFDFGASFGVPEDRSEPAKSFYVGFNYRLDDDPTNKSHKTKKAQSSISVPQSRPTPRPKFSQQPKPITKKKSDNKQITTSYKYRVMIKNATGSKDTAKRVRNFLRENGYRVVSTQSISRRSKTEIRYLNKKSKQALRLALKLPGNQDLREMNKLGKGVDFELVIGSDLVKNIR